MSAALHWARGSRWVTGAAWAFALALLLLVPDVRIIQNFAYLFFGYVGMVDAASWWMLAAIAGGALWAGAGLANTQPRCARGGTAVIGPAPRATAAPYRGPAGAGR